MSDSKPRPDRSWLYIALAFLGFWIVYLAFFAPGRRQPLQGSGIDLPAEYNWNLQDLNEQPVKFSRFKGKTVFLNIWATWCGPCVGEMPSIARLAGNPRLKAKNIEFVCVSTDDSVETAAPLRQREGLAHDGAPLPVAPAGVPHRRHPRHVHHRAQRADRRGRGRHRMTGTARRWWHSWRRPPPRPSDRPERTRTGATEPRRPAGLIRATAMLPAPTRSPRCEVFRSPSSRASSSPPSGWPVRERYVDGEHQARERDREENAHAVGQQPRHVDRQPEDVDQDQGHHPRPRGLPRIAERIDHARVPVDDHVGELRAPHGHIGGRGERQRHGRGDTPAILTGPTRPRMPPASDTKKHA